MSFEDKAHPESSSKGARIEPSITLPKGGGAIRGIGETFAANPVTGTGSMSVPIATSSGRSGFGPQLALSYDSGAGNSPFGFGWSLSLPAVTRKTDKGLPQYLDAQESDVFLLSGSEDLVPEYKKDREGHWVLDQEGHLVIHDKDIDGYRVRRYRPRIEGLFARIERWTRIGSPSDVHWRSISKDNILTLYGNDADSRIYDPDDDAHIFSWLICETRDDKGNALLYRYKQENGIGADLNKANERNRGAGDDPHRAANRYLKRILYGNRSPLLDDEGHRPRLLDKAQIDDQIATAQWMFEVVFDYGEHDLNAPKPNDAGTWAYRPDPFSSYRSGFEVRTTRLCQRVLMFHHFDGEVGVGKDCLVRTTDFTYSDEQDPAEASSPVYSFLLEVTQTGYRRNNSGYLDSAYPPLQFQYTEACIDETIHSIETAQLANFPAGLADPAIQFIDLDGEGLSGPLIQTTGAWYYKRNRSAASLHADGEKVSVSALFGELECLSELPAVALAEAPNHQIVDLDGDGYLEVANYAGPTPGCYSRSADGKWNKHENFESLPNLDWNDKNLRFIDLTGDGTADILIACETVFVWHQSLAKAGFGRAQEVQTALNEEQGARIVFADGTESIFLGDMSGDGLVDLVRIRHDEVCYWPNLGYGRFGAKVTLDNLDKDSPFDTYADFDPRRIRLADVDGSGTTDILYLRADGVHLYFNESGNRLSKPQVIKNLPVPEPSQNIIVTDLLGTGTAYLVFSSPLPANAANPMKYINLMGAQKPHLLRRVINNLGAETCIQYYPSTYFYLKDREAGRPWITRLPFPVHVVERVETYDHVSRNRFVTRYAYHHGYFDGVEREFRGFGMVEQWDGEEISVLAPDSVYPPPSNTDREFQVPPVHTKTWFHTGAWLEADTVSQQYAQEYWVEPALRDSSDLAPAVRTRRAKLREEQLLADSVIEQASKLSPEELREAYRALKGSPLRIEVYADDRSDHAGYPYTVTEQNFAVRRIAPRGGQRHATFLTHAQETLACHYERNPADPRIQHTLTLEVDDYGNVRKSVAIGYGRRIGQSKQGDYDRAEQEDTLCTYTENEPTCAIDVDDTYRVPLPADTRTYELTGYSPSGPAGRYVATDFVELVPQDPPRYKLKCDKEIAYRESPGAGRQCRLIEHVVTLYRKNKLDGLLALSQLESLALPGESYRLAFTQEMLDAVYRRNEQPLLPQPDDVLPLPPPGKSVEDRGGYVRCYGDTPPSNCWWMPSGLIFLSPGPGDSPADELAYAEQHFFLPQRYRDPFHTKTASTETRVTYDAHDLLVHRTTDALDNTVTADNDYRVLQPARITDANGNTTEVAFDALGLVVGTAVLGMGDTLEGFNPDLLPTDINDFFTVPDPHALARQHLVGATTRVIYDVSRIHTTRSEKPDEPDAWQPVFAASIARVLHMNQLPPNQQSDVELGFSYSDGLGREIQKKLDADPGKLEDGRGANPRWIRSGWVVFNNKGKPVQEYEPSFTDHHRFEFGVKTGVCRTLFYDPLDRVVATLHPNHTYGKVRFDPWQQTTYDVNDTVANDPRTDPDIAKLVEAYFKSQPQDWKTWYRTQAGAAPLDRDAAAKAEKHADTPTTAHLDVLGRAFLSVAHNGDDAGGKPILFPTRTVLDVEGNQREVIDALGRVVMRYDYDMLGNRIHQASMEAGERWTLADVAGKPIRRWDSRGHNFRHAYDALRRPTQQWVLGATPDSDPRTRAMELLVDKIEYGEAAPDAATKGLRTRIWQHRDSAGLLTNDLYDCKGNLLASTRALVKDPTIIPDWQSPPDLKPETYLSTTVYDALNRPIESIAPHHTDGVGINTLRCSFNRSGLLKSVQSSEQRNGANAETAGVEHIEYDAKGQRKRIDYANGASTHYSHDEDTFRLTRLRTLRGKRNTDDCQPLWAPRTCEDPPAICGKLAASTCVLQDLNYFYDPVGNITHIRDNAQQIIYFKNQRVEPSNDYDYDPTYRLIRATGREHLGQGGTPIPHSYDDHLRTRLPHPGDGQAMGYYEESYNYDAVGNFLTMRHDRTNAAAPGWNRRYFYEEESQNKSGVMSNRLSRCKINAIDEDYRDYDPHGNMRRMPQLQEMRWDYRDQLLMTCRQHVAQPVDGDDPAGTERHGERTWYVYDANGQRVRKITFNASDAGGGIKDERIYLGDFEVYRVHSGLHKGLVRESLHVMDDKQRVALVETRNGVDDGSPQQVARYPFGNHLGSAALELDGSARIVSYEEYSPYGSTTYQAVSGMTGTPKRYRYTGMERDEESGLNYHGARYYSPHCGRWVSSDPLGIDDHSNTILGLSDNPICQTDTDGTRPKTTIKDDLRKRPEHLRWANATAVAPPRFLHQKDALTPIDEHGRIQHPNSRYRGPGLTNVPPTTSEVIGPPQVIRGQLAQDTADVAAAWFWLGQELCKENGAQVRKLISAYIAAQLIALRPGESGTVFFSQDRKTYSYRKTSDGETAVSESRSQSGLNIDTTRGAESAYWPTDTTVAHFVREETSAERHIRETETQENRTLSADERALIYSQEPTAHALFRQADAITQRLFSASPDTYIDRQRSANPFVNLFYEQ